ncbi:nucleoside diphosphate kinase homolog 5-like [Tachypleus tridentatus]|uniref:nucleoside diphosphate kinase homolog 5-like n=1 Tax=Tachypleus tridentatus TaxID=6853 RepID=UPI003FD6B99A
MEDENAAKTVEENDTEESKPAEDDSKPVEIERTLAIIKPDGVDKANEIEEIILNEGFTILQKRSLQLTPEQASEFYAEHFGKPFYPSLVTYMSGGPIIVMVLVRENAILHWREVIGPTKPSVARETKPDSIRAKYGGDDERNAVHGSDSSTSAEREIRFFFPDTVFESTLIGDTTRDYLAEYINPTLSKALIELCKEKPADPVVWLADWLLANNPYRPAYQETVESN